MKNTENYEEVKIMILRLDDKLETLKELLLPQKPILNFNEVAIYTGLSKSHLYKLTSTGGIPCYKPNGKNIYFETKEINKWILKNPNKYVIQ